jgi:hypothetical protein
MNYELGSLTSTDRDRNPAELVDSLPASIDPILRKQ